MGGASIRSSFGIDVFIIILISSVAVVAGAGRRPFQQRHLAAAADSNASRVGLCETAVAILGYKCHEFYVKTDDGYILNLQRIPQGVVPDNSTNKPPVLLHHGVLVDGVSWLLNSPKQSLALILADSGFDVWIANVRGTRFSRRHVSLDPNKSEFWNWTWDELVEHDLPAIFGFVHQQTDQKIHYVGHSMGTVIALTTLSERKQIDKLKSAALLSPIAYLNHMTTKLCVVAAKAFLGEATSMFGFEEFNPKGAAVESLLKYLCAQQGVNCYDFLTALTGKNCCLNSSTVQLFLTNEPQSTATKNLVHFAQTVRDGVLRKYDYGNPIQNMANYGGSKPPTYNLSNIPHDFPLFLSYGGQDALSDVKDFQTLLDDLRSHDVGKLQVQYVENYGHLDFIMGVTAKDVVYNQVVSFFKNYN